MEKKEYSFTTILIIVIFFLLAVNFLYITTSRKQLEADSFKYLEEVMNQISNNVNAKLDNDINIIKNLATLIETTTI